MRIKNVNEWGDRQENEKSSFSRDCQRNVVWFLISQQELVLERGANRNRNRSFTVGKICIIEFENRSDIWIKIYLRVKLSRIASLMRGERSFDFHYFSHNSREFYSIDASETYDFRIFPFSPIFRSCFTLERIFEKFPDIVSLSLDEFSRSFFSRNLFFSIHLKHMVFWIFCSSYLLLSNESTSFRCIRNAQLSNIPFFPFSEHDNVLLSTNESTHHSMWLERTTFLRSYFKSMLMNIFFYSREFYSKTNLFDAPKTYNFWIFLSFRTRWWVLLISNESISFHLHLKRTTSEYNPFSHLMANFYFPGLFENFSLKLILSMPILFQISSRRFFSIHLPFARIFFLAPSNQTHISIHLSLESGWQPAKLSVVAVSTSRNASCLS